MTNDALKPSSTKVYETMLAEGCDLSQTEIELSGGLTPGQTNNGLRELVRDRKVECYFEGGEKMWRRIA